MRHPGIEGIPHPGDCTWSVDPAHGGPWEKCVADRRCTRWRHRPLSRGGPIGHKGAGVCPKTGGDHAWQPVSFRFETQLLDSYGRVEIRQPNVDAGRVYMVCVPCRSHTYIDTAWVGYRLLGPFEEEENEEAQRREDLEGDDEP